MNIAIHPSATFANSGAKDVVAYLRAINAWIARMLTSRALPMAN